MWAAYREDELGREHALKKAIFPWVVNKRHSKLRRPCNSEIVCKRLRLHTDTRTHNMCVWHSMKSDLRRKLTALYTSNLIRRTTIFGKLYGGRVTEIVTSILPSFNFQQSPLFLLFTRATCRLNIKCITIQSTLFIHHTNISYLNHLFDAVRNK